MSEVKNGKKTAKLRKLYPGYVFIQMRLFGEDRKLINKPWYFVREVAGVIGFVGGEHPAALRQSEIDEIRVRIEAANGKEVPKVRIGRRGGQDQRRPIRQPQRPDRRDRSRTRQAEGLRLHFGRFTPVELEYWQVQRATD